MSLDNSKIRQVILAEHDGLRLDLGELERQLDQVAKGDARACVRARGDLDRLLVTFLRHIEHEERILRPVLLGIDAWGKARVDSMDEEHRHQRANVTALLSKDPLGDPRGWAQEMRAFCHALLSDMAEEEATCLSPQVLRDDVVAVEADSE